MNLAVFDVDGTLTRTDRVDDICFVRALADAHSIDDVSTDWAAYPHTTDSAITSHIFRERFGRAPEEAELLKLKSHFVRLLEGQRAAEPSLFAEVVGASAMLRRLSREPAWRAAIATGGWRVSAALKLKAARVEPDDYPAAFADDGISREEILRAALERAQTFYRRSRFDRVVSVGDGLWDVRAARNLGLPFLGVGCGEREERLRRAGATHVIEDFGDYGRLLACLAEACVPSAEGFT